MIFLFPGCDLQGFMLVCFVGRQSETLGETLFVLLAFLRRKLGRMWRYNLMDNSQIGQAPQVHPSSSKFPFPQKVVWEYTFLATNISHGMFERL